MVVKGRDQSSCVKRVSSAFPGYISYEPAVAHQGDEREAHDIAPFGFSQKLPQAFHGVIRKRVGYKAERGFHFLLPFDFGCLSGMVGSMDSGRR